MLPFTREHFLSNFVTYNEAIWPAQIVAYTLGLAAVVLLLRRTADRTIAGILAAMWIWTGVGYHGLHFSQINRMALAFAALFVVQGAAIAYAGIARERLRFGIVTGLVAWVGIAFVAYSAVLYPLLGTLTGHAYPEMPMFGVTPCPVTIFTFGMFLLTNGHMSYWLLVIPFIWSLIGGSAAFLLAIPQDWLLLASGMITLLLMVMQDRKRSPMALDAQAIATALNHSGDRWIPVPRPPPPKYFNKSKRH